MKRWLAAFSVVMMLGGIWFVFRNEEEQNMLPGRRITFISPMANSGYWGNVAGGILDKGNACDMDVKCVGFSELNLDKQIYAMENAVLSGVDGIVTVAYEDSKEFREIVSQAQEADIPVIFIDSDVEDIGRLCYIGSDNFYAGQLAGEKLAKECGGQGKVAIVTSFCDNANQAERISGFIEALKDFPKMEVVKILEGQSNTGLLREMIVGMMEDIPKISAIFCAEGYGSGVMCKLAEKNRERFDGIKTLVFDYSETIRHAMISGNIAGTIKQNPYEMGGRAVEVLQEYFTGNKEEIRDQYTNVELVGTEDELEIEHTVREDILWHIY